MHKRIKRVWTLMREVPRFLVQCCAEDEVMEEVKLVDRKTVLCARGLIYIFGLFSCLHQFDSLYSCLKFPV